MSIKRTNDEYNSLRAEQVSRIEAIHSMSAGTMTVFLTTWAAAISFLAIYYFQTKITDIHTLLWIGLFQSMLAVLPIIFAIPISVRSSENIRQITRISCYIRVFYECPSNTPEDQYYWETAVNRKGFDVNDHRKSRFSPIFNAEYTVLSICSTILYFFFYRLSMTRCQAQVSMIESGIAEAAADDAKRLILIFEICHIAILAIAIILVIYIGRMVSAKSNIVGLWSHYIQDFLLWGIADKQFQPEEGKSVEKYIKERFEYYNKSVLPDELIVIQDMLSGSNRS